MKLKKNVITENKWIRLIDRYQYSIPKRKYAGIYYIRNVVDGKGYIGLTHDLHARLGSHMHIIRYKDLYINKNEQYQKDAMVLNAHRQFWNFNIEDIEFCILFMVEKSSLSRKELDKLLSDKEKYYISLYDTKENGYNMNGGGIDGIRTLTRESYKRICLANKRKATNGDNIVYCYDIKTQERTYFISNYAFRNFLGMNVDNDCLYKYSIIKQQYLAARSVDALEDKIQEYYSHFDINGVYHKYMPTDDMLRDICKYISEDEYNKKYNQKATYRSYSTFINHCKVFLTDDMREYVLRETDAGTFNIKTMITVYPLDRKTAKKYQEQSIKDGWSYINKKKEDNTYIDSSKYMFNGQKRDSPYDYFMYRYNHTLEETQSHFNITDRDTKLSYENYNNIYYERFKRMFIDNIYILRYTDIHPIERKDESAYRFIDIDSRNNAYDDMVAEDNQEIISDENETQKFPLNTWINFTDRYNYHISTDGVPGVFYIRNKVDKRGYIFYSHDLYSNVAYHTSIIASKQSYINCSEEQLEGNDIMQWHRKIWEFDFEDIEMCLLFEIENSHQMSRSDIEDILLKEAV